MREVLKNHLGSAVVVSLVVVGLLGLFISISLLRDRIGAGTDGEGIKDWKTYKSEEYGYQFQYPADWFFEDDEMGGNVSIRNYAEEKDKDNKESVILNLQAHTKPFYTDLFSLAEQDLDSPSELDGSLVGGVPTRKEIRGLPVVMTERSVVFWGEGPGYYIEKDTEHFIYAIISKKEYPEVVDQIISTIKFSSSVQNPDPVKSFLSAAPIGYQWTATLDWDNSVVSKCLVRENEEEISDGTYEQMRAVSPPVGYRWTTTQKIFPSGENVNVGLCLLRIACPDGKVPNSKSCIVPR
ncbi:MAG: hypothetical protein AAB495_03490 [Patescibacteria group bacterium]